MLMCSNRAIIVELDVNESKLYHENKKRALEVKEPNNVRKRNNDNRNGERINYPQCQTCRRYHLGECRRVNGVCFNCGNRGHLIKDCPRRIGADTVPMRGYNDQANHQPNGNERRQGQAYALVPGDIRNDGNDEEEAHPAN